MGLLRRVQLAMGLETPTLAERLQRKLAKNRRQQKRLGRRNWRLLNAFFSSEDQEYASGQEYAALEKERVTLEQQLHVAEGGLYPGDTAYLSSDAPLSTTHWTSPFHDEEPTDYGPGETVPSSTYDPAKERRWLESEIAFNGERQTLAVLDGWAAAFTSYEIEGVTTHSKREHTSHGEDDLPSHWYCETPEKKPAVEETPKWTSTSPVPQTTTPAWAQDAEQQTTENVAGQAHERVQNNPHGWDSKALEKRVAEGHQPNPTIKPASDEIYAVLGNVDDTLLEELYDSPPPIETPLPDTTRQKSLGTERTNAVLQLAGTLAAIAAKKEGVYSPSLTPSQADDSTAPGHVSTENNSSYAATNKTAANPRRRARGITAVTVAGLALVGALSYFCKPHVPINNTATRITVEAQQYFNMPTESGTPTGEGMIDAPPLPPEPVEAPKRNVNFWPAERNGETYTIRINNAPANGLRLAIKDFSTGERTETPLENLGGNNYRFTAPEVDGRHKGLISIIDQNGERLASVKANIGVTIDLPYDATETFSLVHAVGRTYRKLEPIVMPTATIIHTEVRDEYGLVPESPPPNDVVPESPAPEEESISLPENNRGAAVEAASRLYSQRHTQMSEHGYMKPSDISDHVQEIYGPRVTRTELIARRRNKVKELRDSGLTYKEIARRVNFSERTVARDYNAQA
jgi:hypothetical protein